MSECFILYYKIVWLFKLFIGIKKFRFLKKIFGQTCLKCTWKFDTMYLCIFLSWFRISCYFCNPKKWRVNSQYFLYALDKIMKICKLFLGQKFIHNFLFISKIWYFSTRFLISFYIFEEKKSFLEIHIHFLWAFEVIFTTLQHLPLN